jgi:hypothetical protein
VTPKTIPTVFHPDENLPADVKDAGVRGAGTLNLSSDGITLSIRRPIPFLGTLFGLVAATVGLAAVIACAIGLQKLGFDLLAIRRGGTFVGIWALVAAFAAFGAASKLTGRLFSAHINADIPWHAVRSHYEAHTLQLIWDGKGATCVVPAEHRQAVLDAMPDVAG